mgnify:FL=1
MKKACLLLLSLVIVFCTSCSIFAATDEGFVFKTIKGRVRSFGTEPRLLYVFLAENNKDLYILKGDMTKEISRIRKHSLLITGKFTGSNLEILDYDVVNEKVDGKDVFIGEVYSNGEDIFLLRRTQEVVKITKGLTDREVGHKCLVRGYYRKTGEFEGEMEVIDFIIIK